MTCTLLVRFPFGTVVMCGFGQEEIHGADQHLDETWSPESADAA
jgi:hypothetical protein